MRTKTLLLTAALSAAGIASSMAQAPVYSVNAVGYVNTTLVPGFNLISNPLDNKSANGNTLANLFAGLPVNSQIYKFSGTGYTSWIVDEFTGALDPADTAATTTLTPGEGVFVRIPAAAGNKVITFVGEVMQGQTLTVNLPQGFSIASSKVPVGGAAALTGFPVEENDQIYIYDEATQSYKTSSYTFGAWDVEPNVEVGDAFFVRKVSAKPWTRSFSVNQ